MQDDVQPHRPELTERMQELLTAWEAARDGGSEPTPADFTPDAREQADLARILEELGWVENAPSPGSDSLLFPADRIPGFRLLRRVGKGGVGMVFQATQEAAMQRIVALKVFLPKEYDDPKTAKRLEHELEAQKKLNHPNIPKVYNAGCAGGGLYYLARQYVEGRTLSEAAKEWGGQRQRERRVAEVMAIVARAVHHAHQHGVIHSDLKPANILEDASGTPHVIDFGLAKIMEATDSHSAASGNEPIGTPAYMAPEQATARKDRFTPCDVYSLGAVLYELLTGSPPFEGDGQAIIGLLVAGNDPPLPRQRCRGVDRDLETICLKCLRKEPDRRYASAQALAEDLERWSRREPIHARPVGRFERAWGWCRRNPVVAGLSAALLLALSVGAVVSTLGWRSAHHAQRGSEATNKFLSWRVLGTTRPLGRGGLRRDVTVLEALNKAAPYVEEDFAGQPAIQADLHGVFGRTYFELGDYEQALRHSRERVRLLTETHGDAHRDTLLARASVGVTRLYQGHLHEGEESLREALDRLGQARVPVDEDVLGCRILLGHALRVTGKLQEAEAVLRDGVEGLENLLGKGHFRTLLAKLNLADALTLLDRPQEAESLLREAILVLAGLVGERDVNVCQANVVLATALGMQNKEPEEVKRLLREAATALKDSLGPNHRETLVARRLAVLNGTRNGVSADAEKEMRDLVAAVRSGLGENHPQALVAEIDLGVLIFRAGRAGEAEAVWRAVVARAERVLGPRHHDTVTTMQNLAGALSVQGKHEEASGWYRKVLDAKRRHPGSGHPATVAIQQNLAATLLNSRGADAVAEAEPLLKEVAEYYRGKTGLDSAETLQAETNLAGALQLKGTDAALLEAKGMYERVLKVPGTILGDRHPLRLATENNLASLLASLGDAASLAEAERMLRRTLDARSKALGADHWETLATQNNLGFLLLQLGGKSRLAEAEDQFTKALRGMLPRGGQTDRNTMATRGGLGVVILRLGRATEAERLLCGLAADQDRTLGAENPRTLATLRWLGEAQLQQGRPEEAERLAREILETLGRKGTTDIRLAAGPNALLGGALAASGRTDEAAPLLEAAFHALSAKRPLPAEEVRLVVDRIAGLYEAKGQRDQANHWRQKRPAGPDD